MSSQGTLAVKTASPCSLVTVPAPARGTLNHLAEPPEEHQGKGQASECPSPSRQDWQGSTVEPLLLEWPQGEGPGQGWRGGATHGKKALRAVPAPPETPTSAAHPRGQTDGQGLKFPLSGGGNHGFLRKRQGCARASAASNSCSELCSDSCRALGLSHLSQEEKTGAGPAGQ